MEPQRIQITLIGDTAVGKTCLIFAYKDGTFKMERQTDTEMYALNLNFNGKLIDIALRDTMGVVDDGDTFGPDRYRHVHHYPHTDVFLICFSLINRKSLQHVEDRWLPDIKQFCPGVPFILVGTKQDLRQDEALVNPSKEREQSLITRDEGNEMSRKLGALEYLECSSMMQSGVKEVFEAALLAAVKPMKGPQKTENRNCTVM